MAGLEQGRILARPWEEGSFMSPLRLAEERLGSCAVKQSASALQASPTFTECPWTEDVCVCEGGKVWVLHARGLMSACVNACVCLCAGMWVCVDEMLLG